MTDLSSIETRKDPDRGRECLLLTVVFIGDPVTGCGVRISELGKIVPLCMQVVKLTMPSQREPAEVPRQSSRCLNFLFRLTLLPQSGYPARYFSATETA